MKDKIGIFIQCRLGSSRLPEKVIKELYDGVNLVKIIYTSLTKYLPEYLEKFQLDKNRVLVRFIIPDNEKEFAAYLEKKKIPFYTGSELNVLDRYKKAALHFSTSKIIRLTGDNPFYDLQSLAYLISEFLNSNYDYMAKRALLLGTAAEAFSLQALERCENEFASLLQPEDTEHVSLFLKKNPDKFKLKFLTEESISEDTLKNIRLTIDYPGDFAFIQKLCRRVKNIYNVSNKEIIQMYKEDPTFFNYNNKNKQKVFYK